VRTNTASESSAVLIENSIFKPVDGGADLPAEVEPHPDGLGPIGIRCLRNPLEASLPRFGWLSERSTELQATGMLWTCPAPLLPNYL